jgi:hypothetical protein
MNYRNTEIEYDTAINISSGDLVVSVQYNQHTKNIKTNDRFIFDGQAFKVNARKNFYKPQQATTQILYLEMSKDNESEQDDLINNVAYSNINYSIILNTNLISQSVGYTTQLIATIKLNGNIVNEDVSYESDDVNVATVDSFGNVEFVGNGNCNITVKMTNNTNVLSICNISVQAVPVNNREVLITPNVTELLQGQSEIYTCNLYVDGILTPSSFSFGASGVPSTNYSFTIINGNTFALANIKRYSNSLTILADNGTDTHTINVKLNGSW